MLVGPAIPALVILGPPCISSEFINVEGWLAKGDEDLDSQAFFLVVC